MVKDELRWERGGDSLFTALEEHGLGNEDVFEELRRYWCGDRVVSLFPRRSLYGGFCR